MYWVTEAKYVEDYKIFIRFNDQKEGLINLHDTLFQDQRPIFQALRDLNKFKAFRVAMDTIVWDNGMDLAPEFLREKLS